ncbi:response regulator transcription factor [Corynebacterium sp. AOP40-9SA-29]|uniref:response regulator transcription factor n=1 Tax=Corynebacterium sp. AOP40-9SA-29 TaxID=3457677 RepID=UPI0040346640
MAHRRDSQEAAGTAVVIEDDPDIRDLISSVLQQSGFQVHVASDGATGVDAVESHRPNITTVDLGLPGIDGFEVVRQIRLLSDCYVIIISARTDEVDTLMALNTGADDFITKPFRPRELRARVTAMLRRPRTATEHGEPEEFPESAEAAESTENAAGAENAANAELAGSAASIEITEPLGTAPARPTLSDGSKVLSHNDLRLDPDTRTVNVGTEEIVLTRTEFELLHTLLSSGRRVRTKADLVRHLRAEDSMGSATYVSEADERAVEVHIGNLRRKLGRGEAAASATSTAAVIETVRGVGYKLASASS